MSLQDAVDVLNEEAAGRPPSDRSKLIAATLALETEALATENRDLLDAVAGLRSIANDERMLDRAGSERAAHLAAIVSGHIRIKSRSPG